MYTYHIQPSEIQPLPFQVNGRTFRLIWIATKGDWPYLRKEPRLNGFAVKLRWLEIHMLIYRRNILQLRHVVYIPGLPQPASAIYAMDRSLGNMASCHISTPKKKHISPFLQEWWRLDHGAPWKAAENRPGPTPFKDCAKPFDMIPGGSSCERIRPDIVHTFHIGFGTDLVASMVVWLVRLGLFDGGAGHQAFDDKLRTAYSTFREYCHSTRRFTACDQWCIKKLGMASNTYKRLAATFCFFVDHWCYTIHLHAI